MTDVIIFIDALSPRELTGMIEELYQGNMDSGVPRVTPRVMSSIYTGLNPAENGMMEVSKYGGENTTRPRKSTFIDQAVREDMSVLCMGMPFSIPFRVDQEDITGDVNEGGMQTGGPAGQGGTTITSLLSGTALAGTNQTIPQQAANLVNLPAPDADMIQAHPDRVFASFKDQTYAYFNLFKENIRRIDPDVAFLGYRLVDSYCHFQHTESREGKAYRKHLIEDVSWLIQRISQQIEGDVMFFSDHGQTELTHTFRVNRWLKESDYLDYKVDWDFVPKLKRETRGEVHPVDERVENQLTFGPPPDLAQGAGGTEGVYPKDLRENDSQVVCADPFDSCLTLVCDREEFDEEQFRDDLMSTGMYRSVKYKWELYDEDADFYDSIPDIIPDRAEGVFVSGNIHRNPIGMGYYRTGVHDRTACYGATCELSVPEGEGMDGMITPEQLNKAIKDFMGLEVQTSPIGMRDIQKHTLEEVELISENIEEALQ